MMRRGEIRVVDFGLGPGGDTGSSRPAVVVSNDAANAAATRLGRGVVTVVPVTPHVDLVHPFQVRLPAQDTGLPRDAKAQAEQVRSVAVERVGVVSGCSAPARSAASTRRCGSTLRSDLTHLAL
jgi:mRNA interferase MazF